MKQAKKGDTVKVHYTGKLENGSVFDTSREREPFEFIVGDGSVIQGLEKGIVGMKIGEKKTIEASPQEAFGARREELMANVNKQDFPENIDPVVGQRLQIKQPNGRVMEVFVADVDEEIVTLDANHPLAGETLIFDVELMAIE